MLCILMYYNVHSGACAPCFPNTSSLATISVAMYKRPINAPCHQFLVA